MRNAVDYSYARPSGAELQSKGLDALVYTGNARPDQAYIDDLRAHGVVVTFIMETTSTRSQQGFQAGVYDCQFAESRARQRGHTGSIAVVVSDGNYADSWDATEYGRGWASVATLPYFAYGAVFICETFGSKSQSLGTWVPRTWGMGTLMSQEVGVSPVAGTDLNTVYADYTGTTTPLPVADNNSEEDVMLIINKERGAAILCGNHRPRKIASVNDYHGTYAVLETDAWDQYWDDAIALYDSAVK